MAKKEAKHQAWKLKRTIGQKTADKLVGFVGSWTFIFILVIFIIGWIYLNMTAYVRGWDPWPFIILNLCLSSLAAVQAPIILMSQKRQAQKNTLRAEYDYAVDRKSEKGIREIKTQLERIEKKLK